MPVVRSLFVAASIVLALAVPALGVTPEELAQLTRAGLGDEVLIALIESTGMDRVVDAQRSLALRRDGVSDRVIAAAVRASHREAPGPLEPGPVASDCVGCGDNIAVIGDTPSLTVIQREVHYLPWIWIAPVAAPPGPPRPYLSGHRGFGRFINDGFVDRTPPRH